MWRPHVDGADVSLRGESAARHCPVLNWNAFSRSPLFPLFPLFEFLRLRHNPTRCEILRLKGCEQANGAVEGILVNTGIMHPVLCGVKVAYKNVRTV